uniref:Methyltransferase FkbM domain-containing protein n=1 Tax=viral metagenome TaxID=1070528 RepID=A0A6C0J651_9ZZZZ
MKNTILIVVFNFSNCLNNLEFLKSLYGKYFKKIIFYSDTPEINNKYEVNFMDIGEGYYTHRIFKHFYQKYKSLIEDCDGLFYTMDDNIINLNILNLFDLKKILFFYPKSQLQNNNTENNTWFPLKDIDEHGNGWWWETLPNGTSSRKNIKKLLQDQDFKKFNINKISGGFSDFFYLPKQYLTADLFNLFELFGRYNIFLEMAIPTIINNIEKDINKYQYFLSKILWGKDRKKILKRDYIYNSLNHQHNLILHPIKFTHNPEYKLYLNEIFCKDRCVIITTINKPNETIFKHINNKNYDTIIVGDKKTPDDYKELNCIYLDIPSQKMLFPELCDMIPYNHYCRKNLGYLYAIKKGYNIIYETDDDNIPYDNFDNVLKIDKNKIISEKSSIWINIFKYFTNNAYIWPRGLPITLIKNEPNYSINDFDKKPAIINGLVENDPDVDACFRLICNHQNSIKWEQNKSIIIDNNNLCVFNTQNTFWVNSDLFMSLLIPCSVSFRYCDILRGIISNIILKKTDNYMMYTSPNVIQNRNKHNLIEDFKSEFEMYIHNEKILDYIEDNTSSKLRCLYLIQSIGRLPENYKKFINNKKYVLLSYKNNSEDTDIFFPNSTWTTGRNKLRDYALKMEEKYDYYIFLDEDIEFNNNNNFDNFEELLNIYRPYIGNPHLVGYGEYKILPNYNCSTTVWYDGICNAFSYEAFNCSLIFPYIDKFDADNWWMSQYIMIILCSIYKKEVVVFKNLEINNIQHNSYPKKCIWKLVEDFIINNLICETELDILNKFKSKSIFRIIDFLNEILKKFDRINFIDVGCAIGDVRNLLTHKNIFSIGIDPLIENYKKRNSNLNYNKYNKVLDIALDIDENIEKTFYITESLDTSSLKEFGKITDDINNITDFYIPSSSIKFITTVIDNKKVLTKKLNTIIETHFDTDIIHILKIDCQGTDLNVLKSAGKYINNIMFIIMKSNSDDKECLYKNSTKFSEDYNYLKSQNFELITKEVLLRDDYDCLYYNKNIIQKCKKKIWDHKNFKKVNISKSYIKDLLRIIYNNLLKNKVITQKDIEILNVWFNYF